MSRKHAFLLLVHGAPEQAARLVGALDHPRFSFFVHVDTKTPIEPFQRLLAPYDVTFTNRRHDVWRKCWSMIEATDELMAAATGAGPNFGYYTLLSGADYPVKPVGEIEDFLSSNDEEFLHFFHLDDRPDWLGRVDRYHYRDHAYVEQKEPVDARLRAERALNKARRVRHRLIEARHRRSVPAEERDHLSRQVPNDLRLCGGSQWWSLTHDAVVYLRDRVRSRADERHFFRYVDGPDELYLQTLLVNSAFRNRLAAADLYRDWQSSAKGEMLPEPLFNRRYVDWSEERWDIPPEGGEARGPTTLEEQDFDALVRTPALFARKMHPTRSASLLDRIDAELLVI